MTGLQAQRRHKHERKLNIPAHTHGRSTYIAVDFDGTLCESDWPNIGMAKRDMIDALLDLQKRGAIIILWTCREGRALEQALEWLGRQGLKPDYINENAESIKRHFGNDPRKVSADYYIDDKSRWLE